MKNFLVTTAMALCLSVGICIPQCIALENQANIENKEIAPDTYNQLRQIMLKGSSDELRQLIQKGLNTNGMYHCETPLNMAISSLAYAFGSATGYPPENAIEKVKILIKSGADINFEPCAPATTPLVTAIQLPLEMYSFEESFNNAIDEEIESSQETESCLGGAIPKPCDALTPEDKQAIKESIHETYETARRNLVPYMMEIIEILTDNGANINASDLNKKTPLHRAALTPQNITLEPLKFLIERGANVNAQDINGNTPLFIAYSCNNISAVNLLINAGADVTIRNRDGLLYNQVIGNIERKYLDKEGHIKKDDNFGVKYNL